MMMVIMMMMVMKMTYVDGDTAAVDGRWGFALLPSHRVWQERLTN